MGIIKGIVAFWITLFEVIYAMHCEKNIFKLPYIFMEVLLVIILILYFTFDSWFIGVILLSIVIAYTFITLMFLALLIGLSFKFKDFEITKWYERQ